uniref:Uncharacterized protein n=1 Tax=viral metagenome TaxID=1070528 RepID=A0A6C0JU91_9ZZZZ
MSCDLQIIDISSTRLMILAGAMTVLGMLVPGMLGFVIYSLGWLLVGFNLMHTMPENKFIFWPAICGIVISTLGIRMGIFTYVSWAIYIIAWFVFGYNISGHLPDVDRLYGLGAAVIAIASTLYMAHPFGSVSYTFAWGIISSIYSVPTLQTLTSDILPCVGELSSRNSEIQCALESKCFDKLLQGGLTGKDYINELISAINCAVNTCPGSPWLKTVANKIKCYNDAGCLAAIEANPPTTPMALVIALIGLQSCDSSC